jgi:hypothetical protein
MVIDSDRDCTISNNTLLEINNVKPKIFYNTAVKITARIFEHIAPTRLPSSFLMSNSVCSWPYP